MLDPILQKDLSSHADRFIESVSRDAIYTIAFPAFKEYVKKEYGNGVLNYQIRDRIFSDAVIRLYPDMRTSADGVAVSTLPPDIISIKKRGKLLEVQTTKKSFRILVEDFLVQSRFIVVYFTETCEYFPSVSRKDWRELMLKWTGMIEDVEDVEMLDDLVLECLQSFAYDADERDPAFLSKGYSVLIEGILHFRLSDLLIRVKREVDYKVNQSELISVLKSIGYERVMIGPSSKRMRAWREIGESMDGMTPRGNEMKTV